MNKFNGYAKPLASKAGQKLFPVCFVDASIRTSGPPLAASERFYEQEAPRRKKPALTEDAGLLRQAALASAQWGDAVSKAKESWLKSWYFPLDAFDPWPARTDLCCWWCTCQFGWTPFPLPYQYDVSSNRYRSVGMFCGPSCAKSYAVKVKGYANLDSVFYFIDRVAEDFYGYCIGIEDGAAKRSVIPQAPDRELLQKFCGPDGLTIEQFRGACACGRDIRLLPPSWITIKQVVQAEQVVAKTCRAKAFHRENPDSIQRTDDLVKKRRVPFAGLGVRRVSDYLKTKT